MNTVQRLSLTFLAFLAKPYLYICICIYGRVRPKKADKSTVRLHRKSEAKRKCVFCRWTQTGTQTKKVYQAKSELFLLLDFHEVLQKKEKGAHTHSTCRSGT